MRIASQLLAIRVLASALVLLVLAAVAPVRDARATHDTGTSSGPGACALVTLAFGPDAESASIGTAGERDCYRFNGASGDRVRLRVVAASGTLEPRASVVRPDGTTACAATSLDDSDCVLTVSATHTILVWDGAGTGTGNYGIAIQRVNDPVGCSALSFGPATSTGALANAADADCWRFTGAAGDRVRVTMATSSTTLVPYAQVLRPDGTTFCWSDGTESCTLATGGTYTIIVTDLLGPDTGGYGIGIQRLGDPVGCSALPYRTATTPGWIATVGEADCWRFSALAGDRVRVRAIGPSIGLDPAVEVVRPDGTVRCRPTTDNDSTCLLDAAGTHTILVRDGIRGPRTDTYTISIQRLNNPVGCSTLSYGAPAAVGSLTSAGQAQCWRFAGAAGDRVRLRVIAASGGLDPAAELLLPDGGTRCQTTTADDSTCVLTLTGTHTVLVRDAAPGYRTGSYLVAIQRLGDPVGCSPLLFGPAATPGSIATAAETDCWRFTGAAGDRVRLRLIATTGGHDPSAEVLGPDGTTRCQPTTADGSTCVLGAGGTHTVLVRDAAPATRTGDYALAIQRLNNPVGCSTLTYGTTAAVGSIADAGETDCWRFNGTAGDHVRVRIVTTGGALAARAEVLRPAGTTRCSDQSTCVLDVTGTHTILVRDSSGAAAGDYALALQRLNNPVGCSTRSFGPAPAGDAIAAAGEVDCWRFDGAAGDRVRLRLEPTSGSLDPRAEMVQPDGTTIPCWWSFATGPGTITCVLGASGTHTILVRDDSGLDTGFYALAIQRLNNPVGCAWLPLSSAASTGEIQYVAETDCWRVDGDAGTSLLIRLRKPSGPSGSFVGDVDPAGEVLRPDGTTLCSRTTEDDFTCALDTGGVHTIMVEDVLGRQRGSYEIINQPSIRSGTISGGL